MPRRRGGWPKPTAWTQIIAAFAEAETLHGLVARRRQLVDMLAAEKNRRAQATGRPRKSIEAVIKTLQRELEELDNESLRMTNITLKTWARPRPGPTA